MVWMVFRKNTVGKDILINRLALKDVHLES